MPKILFITVGGSPAPILTAIQSLNPERVIFICSSGSRGSVTQVTGEGKPCENRKLTLLKVNLDCQREDVPPLLEQLGIAESFQPNRDSLAISSTERQPNLVTQLGLSDRFNPETDLILLDNPDDLAECYRLISQTIKAIQLAEPDSELIADYTGGTKTMSLSLGMAAIDYGLTPYLTTNYTRENLFRVERGESTERAPVASVTVERTLDRDLPKFLRDFNYGGAIAALETLLQSHELPSDPKRRIRQLRDICAGFDAWDRFDHLRAWDLLSMHMGVVQEHGLALKRVLNSRQAIDAEFVTRDSIPGHGYELVEDLLRNAERRAHQQRYDDAVCRLYRALELLAQIRLQQEYELQTGNVDLTKLPASLRDEYAGERHPDTGKIQIPLWKSYTLLSQLDDGLLGSHFNDRARALLNAIEVRNNSFLAHGFKPITQAEYLKMGTTIKDFVETGLALLTEGSRHQALPQFPTDLA